MAMSTHLRNLWYFVLPSRGLRRGAMRAKTVLGEPLLLCRGRDGEVFALRDICPHRGLPLSFGWFDGAEVTCSYHGWRFDCTGRCTAIPSLTEGQDFDPGRIKVKRYPCREAQGCIWVFMAGERRDDAPAPDPPEVPEIGDAAPRIIESQIFDCHMDHAVVGLMDPAHGPFVHASWWWRSRRSIHEKAKRFAPSPFGFRMVRHAPSSNSLAYRLLGGQTSTEIIFRLPGVRIEHINAGSHTLCNLTAVTPIDDDRTEVHHLIYWTQPWLTPLAPVFKPFARRFLAQDRRMVSRQQVGLRHNPPLMLINDADTQAKWYYRLKKEWQRVQDEGGDFRNPVKETVLRWRS